MKRRKKVAGLAEDEKKKNRGKGLHRSRVSSRKKEQESREEVERIGDSPPATN